MAVTIKSLNGLSAIKKIGIPINLQVWLETSPIKVALNAKEFVFGLPEQVDGGKKFTVPVSLTDMQKLSMGTLGAAKLNELQTQLHNVITHILAEYGDALKELDPSVVAATIAENKAQPKPSTLSKLPPLLKATPPSPETLASETKEALEAIVGAPKKKGMWLEFPADKLSTAPLTKLRDANQMYQPVLGTSAGSRYYLVAANADLRIAARYLPTKLSIRIEGPGLHKHTKTIAAAGIEVHSGKDYASVHLSVGDDPMMANKTLGAILLGLGVPLDTPFPQLQKIANK